MIKNGLNRICQKKSSSTSSTSSSHVVATTHLDEANFLVRLAGTTLTSTDLVAFDPAADWVSVPPRLSCPDILSVVEEE
jgi:hypothetical protein